MLLGDSRLNILYLQEIRNRLISKGVDKKIAQAYFYKFIILAALDLPHNNKDLKTYIKIGIKNGIIPFNEGIEILEKIKEEKL